MRGGEGRGLFPRGLEGGERGRKGRGREFPQVKVSIISGASPHGWTSKNYVICVLSLSWNFLVSHDKYIARPSSKKPC